MTHNIQRMSGEGAARTSRTSYDDYEKLFDCSRATDQMDRVVNLPVVSTLDEDDSRRSAKKLNAAAS